MNTPKKLIEWMELPGLTDLLINSSREIYLDQGKGLECLSQDPPLFESEELLKTWVLHQLSLVGKTWDAKHPFMDATLICGFRMHVTFPPISRKGILVSLRKLPEPNPSLKRWVHSKYYPVLVEAVQRGDSMIISGATGSGKTTLANDLLGEVSQNERMLALEDTPELAPHHPHFMSLVSRPPNPDGFGEVTLRTLLKQALRMRPDRIILGECRGPEVLELLQALNTGHRGSLTTLHANSPREALRRIELLCLLGGNGNIPLTAIRELLAFGIQWIVQVNRHYSGENRLVSREITEVWKLEGREGDTILMRPLFPVHKNAA